MKKHNRSILKNTLKSLLAKSGNQCAFPNCTHPIFNDDNLFIAQLCHIEAVAPNAPRYNSSKTDRETNDYNNLIFLCYRHHKETDNEIIYTVENLRKMKEEHEANFKENSYKYPDAIVEELIKEADTYWLEVNKIHSMHITPEQALPIDTNDTILDLIEEIKENLSSLSELNYAYMSELKKEYFEFICLAMPNMLARSKGAVDQIEIKHLEELLLKDNSNQTYIKRLEQLRRDFLDIAKRGGLAD